MAYTLEIDSRYCKGCSLCIKVCPKDTLSKGHERSKGGYLMPQFDAEKCIGCRSCELICPDMAICVKEAE